MPTALNSIVIQEDGNYRFGDIVTNKLHKEDCSLIIVFVDDAIQRYQIQVQFSLLYNIEAEIIISQTNITNHLLNTYPTILTASNFSDKEFMDSYCKIMWQTLATAIPEASFTLLNPFLTIKIPEAEHFYNYKIPNVMGLDTGIMVKSEPELRLLVRDEFYVMLSEFLGSPQGKSVSIDSKALVQELINFNNKS